MYRPSIFNQRCRSVVAGCPSSVYQEQEQEVRADPLQVPLVNYSTEKHLNIEKAVARLCFYKTKLSTADFYYPLRGCIFRTLLPRSPVR